MYCPHPFSRMEIKADGGVYCCCEGWLPRPLGNILRDDLLKIWLGKDAREIRSTIVRGTFDHCTACPYLPGPAGPVVASMPSNVDTSWIHTLKLDYDQTCNLTCPSCRVTHSRNFVNDELVDDIHARVLGSGVLLRTIRLYVTGAGDPFASRVYWHLLQNLHTMVINPKLEIFLHTNGLLMTPQKWEEMGPSRDRVSEVGISVDAATPLTYTLNRQGSWGRLWRNIEHVNHLQDSGKKIMLGFFFTVQANNFRELVPFIRIARNHRARWISVTALRNWGTYTSDDYARRAVHVPTHPDHDEFKRVLEDPLLKSPGIVLDSFNPSFTNQEVICNPEALLPEHKVRKR